ncbi:hypothetical protein MRB53_015856 [Persea americana]|uniref:Uncharacterized protein n=1 Tax=Persea americana TaxID=3435 RepID=A0ACC2M099_PERAE|nr:hypothetical protein MRB53_015856 [Persea americana]
MNLPITAFEKDSLLEVRMDWGIVRAGLPFIHDVRGQFAGLLRKEEEEVGRKGLLGSGAEKRLAKDCQGGRGGFAGSARFEFEPIGKEIWGEGPSRGDGRIWRVWGNTWLEDGGKLCDRKIGGWGAWSKQLGAWKIAA